MPAIAPKSPKYEYSARPVLWFWLGITGIFVLSLALRFWGLSRFNTLVFDEVYYAKFASHFLKRDIVFTGHPPLSTYIIAFGIWLGEQMPWGDHSLKNGLAGLLIAPFSYRWLNALTGSFLPLIVAAIAYQLSCRRSYALIAGLLLAADGLFLVESRYALNNVYLVLFGLLGQLFFLMGLRAQGVVRWFYLACAGVGFGASAAIKWNGLGFLLGAILMWIAGWTVRMLQPRSSNQENLNRPSSWRSPLQNLTQLHLGQIGICLAAIPALTYYVSWLPYMALDASEDSFWTLQAKTLSYHERVGGLNAHPYCSLWFTWPLMLRPIAYFYKTSHDWKELPPVVGPPLPPAAGEVIYDVHAMGNPILWWFSTAAMVLLFLLLVQFIGQRLTALKASAQSSQATGSVALSASLLPELNAHAWLLIYLGLNWIANLLPWMKVSRCAFLYHYMESFVFALLALAFLVDRWLQSPLRPRKNLSVAILALVILGFIFWMPIYLGLPMSPLELQLRRWMPSWV